MRKPSFELAKANLPLVKFKPDDFFQETVMEASHRIYKEEPQKKPQREEFYSAFDCYGANIYKIANEFGKELDKVNLKISSSFIPDHDFVCIEFPDELGFELFAGRWVYSVYIHSELIKRHDGTQKREVWLYYPLYDALGNVLSLDLIHNIITIDDGKDLDDIVKEEMAWKAKMDSNLIYNQKVFTSFLQYVLKCILYIESGDPDLRSYHAPSPPKTKKAKKIRLWEREHFNDPQVNLILVGFNWKKPIIYNVDKTLVSGHFRWQPIGEDRKGYKLIWINQHERHYNKV